MPSRRRDDAPVPATLSEADGVRYLHLGTPWIQGAMRIAKPKVIELDYVQRMMAWMLWRSADAVDSGHAVQLGLGAAAITRFTHQVLRMQTTAVEINPSVIAACRLWFQLGADDSRLAVVNQDAAQWLAEAARPGSADVLCVDLYDHEAAAPVLDDEAFYAACRDLLGEGGVMSVNLFGRHSSFERSKARIESAFGADQVWQLAPTREGNTIVIAGRSVELPSRELMSDRAERIESRWKLPARKWLRLLKRPSPVEASAAANDAIADPAALAQERP
jgi:spermidine synthase